MAKTIPNTFHSVYPGLARELVNEVKLSKPLPNAKTILTRALWDTGATGSAITPSVVKKLNLSPTGVTTVKGVGSESQRSTYLIHLHLPNRMVVGPLKVTECDELKADKSVGILVGMDVIGIGDFAVSNYNGRTSFTFRYPSQKETNYVDEANAAHRPIASARKEGLKKMAQNVRNKKRKR